MLCIIVSLGAIESRELSRSVVHVARLKEHNLFKLASHGSVYGSWESGHVSDVLALSSHVLEDPVNALQPHHDN